MSGIISALLQIQSRYFVLGEGFMNWKNTSQRYGFWSITMHWLMFLLIAVTFASMELREFFEKGTGIREAFKTWHFMLGLSILALVSLRLLMYFLQQSPEITPRPNSMQHTLAKVMHGLLYFFMFFMPIIGWLILSGEGEVIPFYGWTLPALISENKELADFFEEVHEIGGVIGYWLIGLHATAALFHHYVLKDNTLLRMLPKRS
ncbi:cytochrome b [Thiomicrorhabdus arctica]|uniref:cytochrome b n=1 Tax=Thiomicrorhabdus arctica TaxID=131540 RepID=UPI00036F48BD|nr:cytochrome b [Thiomicrorhabdus arctica]